MTADRELVRLWCELAPGEYIEGANILPSVLQAIDRRGWELHMEEIMIDRHPALKATVTHGAPVLSILGEVDVVLAAYVDALQSIRWFQKGIY